MISRWGSCCVLSPLKCCSSVVCFCFRSASCCSWVAHSCRHRFKVWGFNPSVMWPGHSSNGRARLRFQPRRREQKKEGGREGRQALNCAHYLDSQPAVTAPLSLLLLLLMTALFVWPVVWVIGWHPLKRVRIPPLGKTQERVRNQSKKSRRRKRERGGSRQQHFPPLIFASAGASSVKEWGQELWPSVWVES